MYYVTTVAPNPNRHRQRVLELAALAITIAVTACCTAQTETEAVAPDGVVGTNEEGVSRNFLSNPGFERDLSDWSAWGNWLRLYDEPGANVTPLTTAAYAGQYGLRITDDSWNKQACVEQMLSIPGGKRVYRIDAMT